jgi:hypothetical protein
MRIARSPNGRWQEVNENEPPDYRKKRFYKIINRGGGISGALGSKF